MISCSVIARIRGLERNIKKLKEASILLLIQIIINPIGFESDDVKNGLGVVSWHQISILDPLRCDFAIASVCGCTQVVCRCDFYFATRCHPAPIGQISQFHWLHHLAVSKTAWNVLGSIQKLDPGGSSFWIFQIVAMPLLCCDIALSSPIRNSTARFLSYPVLVLPFKH